MGLAGNIARLLAPNPDAWAAKAIKRIEETEETLSFVLSDVNNVREIKRWGNFLAVDALGAGFEPPEGLHPDAIRVGVSIKDEEPDPTASDDDEDEIILRPGQSLVLPYSSVFVRLLDVGGLPLEARPTHAVIPRARVWYGWSLLPVKLPAAPVYQRPIRPIDVAQASGTIVDSVGTTSEAVAANPATWATVVNNHATQTLSIALGTAAVAGDGIVLAAGAASPAIPIANTGQIRVIGSGAATDYSVLWTLDV